jgi:putative endonuclease
MVHGGSVYILTNKNNTTVYTGVTSDLQARLWEHQHKIDSRSFTSKYNLVKLVYYEHLPSIEEAIDREKYIKGKVRRWKNDLITSRNPEWKDLTAEVAE